MPLKNHPPKDTNELLDSIRYVNQKNREEENRIGKQLRARISNAGLKGDDAENVIDELSRQLGQLKASTNLVEKAIRSISQGQENLSMVKGGTNITASSRNNLKFGTSQLTGNKNLLPIETNDKGIDYAWTGADPETHFTFELDRRKKLGMQIRLVSLIKPEYTDQLKVYIDGVHIIHHLSEKKGIFTVSCNLPSSNKTDHTNIKIVLPATHRPKDVTNSGDGRKLGIAINEITFRKAISKLDMLLNRVQ